MTVQSLSRWQGPSGAWIECSEGSCSRIGYALMELLSKQEQSWRWNG